MGIPRRTRFRAYLAFCLSLAAQACSDRSIASRDDSAGATASTQTSSAELTALPRFVEMTMAGPRIQIDSSLTEPRLDVANNTYVLRLPAGTAKVLYDSLPGFSPLQLTSYPKVVTPPFTYIHSDVELPSVLLGDFNGDSKVDVALEGRSTQTRATVILLSNSPKTLTPQLVLLTRGDATATDTSGYLGLLHPKEIIDPYTLEVVVRLHSDGVQRVVPYESSVVYYFENGKVRQYTHPGD